MSEHKIVRSLDLENRLSSLNKLTKESRSNGKGRIIQFGKKLAVLHSIGTPSFSQAKRTLELDSDPEEARTKKSKLMPSAPPPSPAIQETPPTLSQEELLLDQAEAIFNSASKDPLFPELEGKQYSRRHC